MNERSQDVGVVLIGRNEGARLLRALASVVDGRRPVVYVDSASTDGSPAAAAARGASVVELDMSVPFTAARARNAGFQRLVDEHPGVRYVQFIDGDCEVVAGWLERAQAELERDPRVVAVCGYRREQAPGASIYNCLCDVEWRQGPVGETTHFGGDVMIRAGALRAVGAYDPQVIAAEDDELSVRLRHNGGKIVRLDAVSTLHDADMHSLEQWWRRAKRCGHGYAQVARLHGRAPERKFRKQLRRAWLWGLAAPSGALLLALPTLGLSWLSLAYYPATAARVALDMRRRGFSGRESMAWGISCSASVFPEALGALKFHADALRKRAPEIIEYKGGHADAR